MEVGATILNVYECRVATIGVGAGWQHCHPLMLLGSAGLVATFPTENP